jgi:membrane complex biogenesis BtpA family protein
MELKDLFPVDRPIIAPVALLPLPGSPRYHGRFDTVVETALEDAKVLVSCGVDGLTLENLGDAPYFKTDAPPETVAAMTRVLWEIRQNSLLPIGVNVLRNCARASLAVASAAEGTFIRVNVLTEAFVTDQGIIEGVGAELMRARKLMAAEGIAVFADVHVKHASPLLQRPIRESALDMVERGLADVLVVSGSRTGQPPTVEDLRSVRDVGPVVIGSGLTAENVEELLPAADGAIVATAFRVEGDVRNRVDPARTERIMSIVGRLGSGSPRG